MKFIIVGIILLLLGLFANGQEEHELPFDIPQEENDYDNWWDDALPEPEDEVLNIGERDCLTEYHICIEAIPFIDGKAETECLEKYQECVNLLDLFSLTKEG